MSSQKNRIYILLFLIFLSRAEISRAQDTGNDEAPIRVNTVLLNIPVVASDKQGRNASNLKKENFSVIQDGEKQPIVFFADQEGPMNVAIIMDVSGSVRSVISDIRRAARNFVAFFSPNDSGMIVSFDKGVHILQPLTSSQKKLAEGISAAFISDEPGSMSNMNDAIFRVVTKDFASIKGRKAIVVLTDGYVGGKISNQRLLDVLIESDILVYPIFYQTQPIILPKGNEKSRFAAKTITLNELVKIHPFDYLNSLTLATGGRLYAADGSDFAGAFQNIADDLRKQYVVGFYPKESDPGKSNDIRVEIDRKDVVIRTKRTIRAKNPAADVP